MKLLITGAGEVVGSMLRDGLRGSLAGQMRLLDLNSIEPGIGDASANRRGWWDLEPGRKLGYEPQDDAETFAAEIEPGPPCEFQGGSSFIGPGTTP